MERELQRPVCYQNMPQSCLREELKDGNPMKIYRLVNGKNTNEEIKNSNE